jgi:hypothetical protein
MPGSPEAGSLSIKPESLSSERRVNFLQSDVSLNQNQFDSRGLLGDLGSWRETGLGRQPGEQQGVNMMMPAELFSGNLQVNSRLWQPAGNNVNWGGASGEILEGGEVHGAVGFGANILLQRSELLSIHGLPDNSYGGGWSGEGGYGDESFLKTERLQPVEDRKRPVQVLYSQSEEEYPMPDVSLNQDQFYPRGPVDDSGSWGETGLGRQQGRANMMMSAELFSGNLQVNSHLEQPAGNNVNSGGAPGEIREGGVLMTDEYVSPDSSVDLTGETNSTLEASSYLNQSSGELRWGEEGSENNSRKRKRGREEPEPTKKEPKLTKGQIAEKFRNLEESKKQGRLSTEDEEFLKENGPVLERLRKKSKRSWLSNKFKDLEKLGNKEYIKEMLEISKEWHLLDNDLSVGMECEKGGRLRFAVPSREEIMLKFGKPITTGHVSLPNQASPTLQVPLSAGLGLSGREGGGVHGAVGFGDNIFIESGSPQQGGVLMTDEYVSPYLRVDFTGETNFTLKGLSYFNQSSGELRWGEEGSENNSRKRRREELGSTKGQIAEKFRNLQESKEQGKHLSPEDEEFLEKQGLALERSRKMNARGYLSKKFKELEMSGKMSGNKKYNIKEMLEISKEWHVLDKDLSAGMKKKGRFKLVVPSREEIELKFGQNQVYPTLQVPPSAGFGLSGREWGGWLDQGVSYYGDGSSIFSQSTNAEQPGVSTRISLFTEFTRLQPLGGQVALLNYERYMQPGESRLGSE